MTTRPERQVFITGFGGQGIVMAGDILGKAATLYDRRHATMMQTYGPEARGGSCSSQVIISDREILFPSIGGAGGSDLHEPGGLYEKCQKPAPRRHTHLGHGPREVPEGDAGLTTYNIPATRFAEELGNTMMANIVMLGFLAAVQNVVSVGALREAVAEFRPAGNEGK